MARERSDDQAGDRFKRFPSQAASAVSAFAQSARALFKLRGSLRAYLFIFAAALVAPLLFAVGLALVSVVSSENFKARQQLIRTAEDISRDIDREIVGFLAVLKTLSTSELLEKRNLREFHRRATTALFDRQANVLLLDPSLQQLLNTRVPFGTELPKTSDEESARIVLSTGSHYVSDVFLGQISGQRVVNIEVPVSSGQTVKYVLLITLDASHFGEILAGVKAAEGFTITLSDRKGQIISTVPQNASQAAPPSAIDLQANVTPAIRDYQDEQGDHWVEASVWSHITGWRTSVTAVRGQFDTVLWTSVRWFLFAIAFAVILTIVLGTFMGGRLEAQISDIKRATVQLAHGAPVDARNLPLREANEVMNALSRTSALISSRTARLQESEERSQEQVRQIDTLMRELAHRNKNQLAIILAMARQLVRSSTSLEEFEQKFAQRIMAKAEAQNLVSQGAGHGVSLARLLDSQMRPFAGENSPQILASGPEVFLTAEAARTIGMAFHELATNATKYGALKQPQGRISVNWSVSAPDKMLKIEWREKNGPEVRKAERSGFGQTIIETYVARTLDADVIYKFDSSGICWTFEAADIVVEA